MSFLSRGTNAFFFFDIFCFLVFVGETTSLAVVDSANPSKGSVGWVCRGDKDGIYAHYISSQFIKIA